MIKAVEDVVGTVHQECVSERSSSKGAYISVTVSNAGPLFSWHDDGNHLVPT